ncbi:hypothetical protein CH380_07075 [Leptospira adleri]|uniref:Uncharacterized protein n=1 Tax=Leptospira adleri TaxID=2023186 RepID=A0A2M9YRV8_9LEPT|nr:hypothetical protein CH380_07075 [Leptospira adleri]PJZ59724.1 hypothetical protein CH376_22255 [Leptospira adleri]
MIGKQKSSREFFAKEIYSHLLNTLNKALFQDFLNRCSKHFIRYDLDSFLCDFAPQSLIKSNKLFLFPLRLWMCDSVSLSVTENAFTDYPNLGSSRNNLFLDNPPQGCEGRGP